MGRKVVDPGSLLFFFSTLLHDHIQVKMITISPNNIRWVNAHIWRGCRQDKLAL